MTPFTSFPDVTPVVSNPVFRTQAGGNPDPDPDPSSSDSDDDDEPPGLAYPHEVDDDEMPDLDDGPDPPELIERIDLRNEDDEDKIQARLLRRSRQN